MLLTERYHVRFALLILLLFGAGPGFAQPLLLNRVVTVSATNKPISAVLQQLSKETSIRFSYDPVQLSTTRKITLSLSQQKLEIVLRSIFNDPGIQFREVGGQIVIYKNKTRPDIPEPLMEEESDHQQISLQHANGVGVTQPLPDTVFIRTTDTITVTRLDTLILTHTIIQRDTLRVTDTLFIDRPVKGKINEMLDRAGPLFGDRSTYSFTGWYAGVAYEQILGKPLYESKQDGSDSLALIMGKASSSEAGNFSLGFIAGYDTPLFGLSAGIAYTRLGEKFDYEYNSLTGGYFRTDTVETYYTVAGVDTSWFFVTDSSWVNIDYKKYSFTNPNYYKYFEIPLMIKLRLIQKESLEVYLAGGVIPAMRIRTRALLIRDDPDHTVDWLKKEETTSFLLSWQLGLGAGIPIGKRWEVFAECSYRNQLGSQLKDFPVGKKFNSMNIKTGIFVRL